MILTLLVIDAVLVTAMLVPMPATKTEQCGVFNLTQMMQGSDSSVTASSCFGEAFFACQPATLTYVNSEDQFHIITIEKHLIGCNIVDTVQAINGLTQTITYVCSGVRILRWGLIINGCGDDQEIRLLIRIRLR